MSLMLDVLEDIMIDLRGPVRVKHGVVVLRLSLIHILLAVESAAVMKMRYFPELRQ